MIVGKKIKSVEILTPGLVKAPLESFRKAVLNSAVKNVRRRAKLLIVDLSSGYSLLIHLKMSGQLIYSRGTERNSTRNYAELPNKHTHIVYIFADGGKLYHNDLRKFGFVKLLKTEEVLKYLEKEKYGPEPLEKNFTFVVFDKILKNNPKKKTKQLLMDQKIVAGIGNLYADEICFYAKVMPTRVVSDLKNSNVKNLFEGIREILEKAVARRGSSADQYVDAEGKKGTFVPLLKVYGRKGERCLRCGGVIGKIKLGGRGTHFCPKCQK